MNAEPTPQVLIRSATLMLGVILVISAMSSLYVLKVVGLTALYTPGAIQAVIGLAAIASWFVEADISVRKKILFGVIAIAVLNGIFAVVLFFQNVESLRKAPAEKPSVDAVSDERPPANRDSDSQR